MEDRGRFGCDWLALALGCPRVFEMVEDADAAAVIMEWWEPPATLWKECAVEWSALRTDALVVRGVPLLDGCRDQVVDE